MSSTEVMCTYFAEKRSTNIVQQKRQIFLGVLRRVRADNQPGNIDTPDDYTRVWADQIDRGGLYQIKPEVNIVHVHVDVSTIYL